MDYDYILPACYAETLLMKTIGYFSKNHKRGDGEVINTMDNKMPKNKLFIGVMDKPKGTSPNHINKNYRNIANGPNGIYLKRKPNSRHYIIYIDSLLEDWVSIIGKSKKIERPYSKDNNRFVFEMKKSDLLTNRTIINYFESINENNAFAFKQIRKWIEQIKKNEL